MQSLWCVCVRAVHTEQELYEEKKSIAAVAA